MFCAQPKDEACRINEAPGPRNMNMDGEGATPEDVDTAELNSMPSGSIVQEEKHSRPHLYAHRFPLEDLRPHPGGACQG